MSTYITETEQLELIKKWWQRYQGVITVVLSLILLLAAGIKYAYWHHQKVLRQSSATYEQMMLAFASQNIKGVRGYANQLMKAYNGTIYADAARLTLARMDIERLNYPAAQKLLREVAKHSSEQPLQYVAKIRLARLLIAEKKYDKALRELSQIKNKAYLPIVNELKGDIFVAKGNKKRAIAFYQAAIKAVKMQGMGNLFLEMKASELSVVV